MGYRFSKPKTFTAFPDLPAETRLEILALAVPGPRVITIKRLSGNPVIHDPAIGMLGASYLSRVEILKHWKLCFAGWNGHPVYFNPDLDILLFDNADVAFSFLIRVHQAEGSLICSIAVNAVSATSSFLDLFAFVTELGVLLDLFPNLEKVAFVVRDSAKLADSEAVTLKHHLELNDRILGRERGLPEFSVLTYKSTPRGVEGMKKELVARRLAASRVNT